MMLVNVLLASCFVFSVNSVDLKHLKKDDSFELSVVHMNDFHARFEETNLDSGSCKSDDCIGGYSRLYEQVSGILKKLPDSVVLNAGDNFQGTIWYTFFKWNVTQYFLNKLPLDAVVLGNHEFDDGIAGVVPFIKALKAPVVVSNIDDSQEPDLQNLYTKSTVVVRNGKKIGIVGVIVSTCDEISNTGKLKFHSESASVNSEAERLVTEEDVFTVIVLSHSGYDVEQQIAANATSKSKIGLVVGGHSHTFLYTGEPSPGPDSPEGPYPTVIKRQDGKTVLVTQASCYSKYLGNISIVYDGNGEVLSWEGSPIFLDHNLPQNEDINNELEPWQKAADAEGDVVLGSTAVTLDQSQCYVAECLLGNFVADSMIFSYMDQADSNSWAGASISVFNAGGLRTSIEKGNITFNDMVTAQPFGNTFDISDIDGQAIKDTFEFCTSPYSYGRASVSITLLQVSGIHVIFDLTKPEGQRAVSIQIRCRECEVPSYEPLDVNKTYRIITPSFLTRGGDGFTVLSDNLRNTRVGSVDIDVFKKVLASQSPIRQSIEGRITILGAETIEARNL